MLISEAPYEGVGGGGLGGRGLINGSARRKRQIERGLRRDWDGGSSPPLQYLARFY